MVIITTITATATTCKVTTLHYHEALRYEINNLEYMKISFSFIYNTLLINIYIYI